jgi:DNA-binding NtrC family response regulator
MLEGDGRPVVQFASADEALPWLNVHLPRVDAVVSDAVMPGVLDGKDLAVEMGRARPDLPFILLTGFTEHAPQAAKAAAGLQFFRMLNKPYDADELLAVLKQLEHARLKADNTQLSRPDLEPTG